MGNKITAETYQGRVRQQLEYWAAGESIHNEKDNECCPDFSCCEPHLLQPEEIRKTYLNAPRETQEDMLVTFLGAGLESWVPNENVQIINGSTEIKTINN